MLNNTLTKQFVDLLMQLPATETYRGRSMLLQQGLPSVSIPRDEGNRRMDVSLIILHMDQLGRLKDTGIRPLVVIARNARDTLEGWQGELTALLEDMIQRLEAYYVEEMADMLPQLLLDIEPEALLFRSRDYRVPLDFLQKAIRSARSVARLYVTICQRGRLTDEGFFGTGWLIAPGLLITNYHVVEARRKHETPASQQDLHMQANHMQIWFDYYEEQINGTRVQCNGSEFVYGDAQLDYALLRVNERQKIADREALPLVRKEPILNVGYHLNVIQHPGGGALKYALRNNFYAGTRQNDERWLHYFSDTEPGSSGSPVLNDAWEAIALHHAAVPVKKHTYDLRLLGLSEREQIGYRNEGVAIVTVLDSLPSALRQEVVGGL